MADLEIPARCPVCNTEGSVVTIEEATWSPPLLYGCQACGYWGETPDDLKFSLAEWEPPPISLPAR